MSEFINFYKTVLFILRPYSNCLPTEAPRYQSRGTNIKIRGGLEIIFFISNFFIWFESGSMLEGGLFYNEIEKIVVKVFQQDEVKLFIGFK